MKALGDQNSVQGDWTTLTECNVVTKMVFAILICTHKLESQVDIWGVFLTLR